MVSVFFLDGFHTSICSDVGTNKYLGGDIETKKPGKPGVEGKKRRVQTSSRIEMNIDTCMIQVETEKL